MGKTLLVIGGTGVISYAVVLEALRQGFDVTCLNRGRTKTQVLPDDVKVLHANYRDRKEVESVLYGKYYTSIINVLCYNEEDIEYSVSLFKDKCEQYIFFSSCAVYNKGQGDYECTEDSKLINPLWQYSKNKVKCEEKLKELAIKDHFNYTIVRPAVTYGNTRIPYGITPPYGYHGTLILRIMANKPIIIWDEGKTIATITRVEDFAIGLVGILGNKEAYNETYHIVGDERHTWKVVIETLGEIIGEKPVLFNLTKEEYASEIPSKRGELLGGRGINQLLDNKKIKSAVNSFKTNISLKEGLAMTVKYYQENYYLKGVDWKYDANTDRIIKKWCAKKKISNKQYKLKFVDYLGNASYKDKIDYFLEYHKNTPVINCLYILKKIIIKLRGSNCKNG